MIKILYILEATSGGTQKHVIDIAKKIDRSEFQIDIVYSTNRNKHFNEEAGSLFNQMFGLPIHRNASFADITTINTIRKIIRKNKYDIIHCHSTKAGFVGRIAAFLSRHKNIIYSPHGFMFCDTRIRFKRNLYLLLEKYLGFLTKRIIAVSGSERELAINNNIVPDKKIVTINNSIDPYEFIDFSYINKVKDKFHQKNDDIIIGTVGRLFYQKDPITLIKGFKLINEKVPNTKLILVGDGPMENDCMKLVKELGLTDRVKFEGFQKDSKSFYKMFDIFILSSHYEGMPYALLEAMSMGIPAVGTDVTGIKDLINHGETGYLVPEGDYEKLAEAVLNLIENPDKLSVFSQNSSNQTKLNYNLDHGIKSYEEFYSKLVFQS